MFKEKPLTGRKKEQKEDKFSLKDILNSPTKEEERQLKGEAMSIVEKLRNLNYQIIYNGIQPNIKPVLFSYMFTVTNNEGKEISFSVEELDVKAVKNGADKQMKLFNA